MFLLESLILQSRLLEIRNTKRNVSAQKSGAMVADLFFYLYAAYGMKLETGVVSCIK